MNDEALDALVAQASSVTERQVDQLPLTGAEDDLREAIMSTVRTSDEPVTPSPFTPIRHGHGGRLPRRLLAPVAAAVIALVGLVSAQQLQGSDGRAWAAEAVAVAEAAPRLLVDRPGWSVDRADEFSAAQGEMTFTDGHRQLELSWEPIVEHQAKVAGRARESDFQSATTVAGREAVVFRYAGTSDFVALWAHGRHSVEARGIFPAFDEFAELLVSLGEVDVDSWLGAMPASVVKPDARVSAVDEMFADIPVPEGFDRTSVEEGVAVQDRYQLGAAVAGSAACAWIEQWITATDDGDASRAQQAVDAMATARDWAVLREMQQDGAYPDVVWRFADAIATGQPVLGGREMSVREAYVDSLGCATR